MSPKTCLLGKADLLDIDAANKTTEAEHLKAAAEDMDHNAVRYRELVSKLHSEVASINTLASDYRAAAALLP